MKSGIKKTIAVTSVSAMLLATAAYGTLAYFTDQDTAKNEFTTGNINIDLTETEWSVGVDIEDWNESKKEEASKLDKGFKYGKFQAQGIVPGREIPKNPAVTVQQSNVPTYVRMTVTMPESMFEVSNLNLPEDAAIISIGGMSSEWNLVGSRLADDKVTLIYDYAQIVDAQDDDESLPELFTQVSVSEKATNDDVQEALTSEFDMEINAYAVQAEGFNTATEAFGATFEETVPVSLLNDN